MGKLHRSLGSDDMVEGVAKGCAASLPRWRYIRELKRGPYKTRGGVGCESADSDMGLRHVSVPIKMRGVARAQKGFLEERRRIVLGRDAMTEFLVNRETSAESLRLLNEFGGFIAFPNLLTSGVYGLTSALVREFGCFFMYVP